MNMLIVLFYLDFDVVCCVLVEFDMLCDWYVVVFVGVVIVECLIDG